MILNELDYIIIFKTFDYNDFNRTLNHFLIKISNQNNGKTYVSKMVKAFESLYPNKELPEILKKEFYVSDVDDIYSYFYDSLMSHKQPEKWAFDCIFYLSEKMVKFYDLYISNLVTELLEIYLKYFTFDDIDTRFFKFIKDPVHYYIFLTQVNRKMNLKKLLHTDEKFKLLFKTPLKFGRMELFKFLKRLFEEKYDLIDVQTPIKNTLFDIVEDNGILDEWLNYAIEKDLAQSLINEILSFGVSNEELPKPLRKIEEERRKKFLGKLKKNTIELESFKSYLINKDK